MKDNVILIGMPGAGKSTIGVVLAKTLGMNFVDSDLVVQNRENRLLQNIINEEGMDYFLECEEEAVLSIEGNRMVVATGGSVIYRKAAMEHLRALGRVIYLDVSYTEIERRVNNITTRGIAIRHGATLKDVAALANVHPSTVSRVIRNVENLKISNDTKVRIFKAIKELNYHPDQTARSLRLKKSFTIGLIMISLFPFILGFFSLLFWKFASLFKSTHRETYKRNAISMTIIFIFLLYPQIVNHTFAMFNCIQIEDRYFLKRDLNIECWQQSHIA